MKRIPLRKQFELNYAARQREILADSRVWTLSATALIERPPVVAPLPEQWEEEHFEWTMRLRERYARDEALLEERKEQGSKRQKKKARKQDSSSSSSSSGSSTSSGDQQESEAPGRGRSGSQLLADFMRENAARVTRADAAGDEASPLRKLDRRLFLCVSNGGSWGLAGMEDHKMGETMRETAERAARGVGIMAVALSNAPSAVFVDEKELKKVFVFRMLQGDGEMEGEGEHKWLCREEVKERLPKELFEALRDCLLP